MSRGTSRFRRVECFQARGVRCWTILVSTRVRRASAGSWRCLTAAARSPWTWPWLMELARGGTWLATNLRDTHGLFFPGEDGARPGESGFHRCRLSSAASTRMPWTGARNCWRSSTGASAWRGAAREVGELALRAGRAGRGRIAAVDGLFGRPRCSGPYGDRSCISPH